MTVRPISRTTPPEPPQARRVRRVGSPMPWPSMPWNRIGERLDSCSERAPLETRRCKPRSREYMYAGKDSLRRGSRSIPRQFHPRGTGTPRQFRPRLRVPFVRGRRDAPDRPVAQPRATLPSRRPKWRHRQTSATRPKAAAAAVKPKVAPDEFYEPKPETQSNAPSRRPPAITVQIR